MAMAEAGAGSPHGGDTAAPGPPEEQELSRRLRRLYPAVNQEETPLPRSWSPKDKYNYIGLSQGNLRVHYKEIAWEPSPRSKNRFHWKGPLEAIWSN
uniref:Ran-binding protein 10 n=1 Tax=Pavo cristatus TaxID=9049 RepID=A0A8C9L4P9_PAVCR